MSKYASIVSDIVGEMVSADRQWGGTTLERRNTDRDFVRYSLAYLGRAVAGARRNEGIDRRSMFVKAAGLLVRVSDPVDDRRHGVLAEASSVADELRELDSDPPMSDQDYLLQAVIALGNGLDLCDPESFVESVALLLLAIDALDNA